MARPGQRDVVLVSSVLRRRAATILALPSEDLLIRDHPQRIALSAELHARPFMTIAAPARIWHYAFFHETSQTAGQPMPDLRDAYANALRSLFERHGLDAPASIGSHVAQSFPDFDLRFESHAEFATVTLIREGPMPTAFGEEPALAAMVDWLCELPGTRLVALKVVLWSADNPAPELSEIRTLLDRSSLSGAQLKDAGATMWTDFRIHADGYERLCMRNVNQNRYQLGRLVQRTLELFNYRALSLLALPVARKASPQLADTSRRLASLIESMRDDSNLEDDRSLLDELVRLSAEIERLGTATGYRFNAARAYFALVDARLKALEETRLDQLQTVSAFLTRRLGPARRTVEAVSQRQERLSDRVMRASNLLRTRVDCQMEAQNRDLLRSMARRARVQLRLQQTVEGLSVAAIAYYIVGLVGYVVKGGEGFGLGVSPEVVQALAVPVIVGLLWLGLRRHRAHLEKADREDDN